MLGLLSQDPGPWTGAAQIQVSLPSSVKPFLETPSQTQTLFPTAVPNPVRSTVKTSLYPDSEGGPKSRKTRQAFLGETMPGNARGRNKRSRSLGVTVTKLAGVRTSVKAS